MDKRKAKKPARKPKSGEFLRVHNTGRLVDVQKTTIQGTAKLPRSGPAGSSVASAHDPDNLPITEKDIADGKLVMVRKRGRPVGSRKTQKTVRLDDDVIEALQADGTGWQTRMNAILREALKLDNSDAKAS
jgi:uncharacterized protein (DUF4415 family)